MSLLSDLTIQCESEYINNSSSRYLKQLPIPDPSSFPVITDFTCKQFATLLGLNMHTGPWLAGGSVRKMITDVPIGASDFDFWFPDADKWASAVKYISNSFIGVSILYSSANAVTFAVGPNNVKMQLISRNFYNSPEQLISEFDFTCCQLATDGNAVLYGEQTAEDLASNTLRLVSPKRLHPGLLKRVIKYRSYGFTLDRDSYQVIVENINDIAESLSDEY